MCDVLWMMEEGRKMAPYLYVRGVQVLSGVHQVYVEAFTLAYHHSNRGPGPSARRTRTRSTAARTLAPATR